MRGKPHRKCKMYFSNTIGIRISDIFQSLQRFLTEMIYLPENVEKNNCAFLTWHREPHLYVPFATLSRYFHISIEYFGLLDRKIQSFDHKRHGRFTYFFIRRTYANFSASVNTLCCPFTSSSPILFYNCFTFSSVSNKEEKMTSVYTPVSLVSVSEVAIVSRKKEKGQKYYEK